MTTRNRWIVAGLVVLNGILGVAAWQSLSPTATAYGQSRRNGDYIVLSRRNITNVMTYVLDTSTGALVALKQEPQKKEIKIMARRDVTSDIGRSTR